MTTTKIDIDTSSDNDTNKFDILSPEHTATRPAPGCAHPTSFSFIEARFFVHTEEELKACNEADTATTLISFLAPSESTPDKLLTRSLYGISVDAAESLCNRDKTKRDVPLYTGASSCQIEHEIDGNYCFSILKGVLITKLRITSFKL